MAYALWSQDIFSKGELSPYMYARVTVNEYNNGLKTAVNVLSYPSGGLGKRFGTLYQTILSGLTSYNQLYFQTFQYLNECVYQLIFIPNEIQIYLEGILVKSVATSLNAAQIYNMNTTVLASAFRCTGDNFKPLDLLRSSNTPISIASFNSPEFTLSSAGWDVGKVLPIRFSVTGGTIMQTDPPITIDVTYFVATTAIDKGIIFLNPQQAKSYLINTFDTSNAFTITSLGTGTTSATALNTWSFSNPIFKNYPTYDFNSAIVSYDSLTFTPSATTGNSVTITVSSAYSPLDSSYVGGGFIGGGGIGIITAVASTTSFTVTVQRPFDSTSAIPGSLALLTEPAWSDKRGWPRVCSSYQSRALFANNQSLPNGFWASAINDYADFSNLTRDDDDAVSWYPTSDNMNYIKFILPYRSVTVHTNTGIYSSPLSDINAITPNNFTLQLQDSTPATVLQPQAIDNQVLVLSGNDAHQMLWDGLNNAYSSNIVSVINEQTIRDPVDETAFVNLTRAGSRFVFIINSNGTMAVFQTLISQNVSGFIPQIMEQSNGNAKFLQAASSSDGRCWFVVERQIVDAQSPVSISGHTSNTLQATAINFSTSTPTAVSFTTSGNLPPSSPQLVVNHYYWAVGVDANHFKVYLTQNDAISNVNAISFLGTGTSSNAIKWALKTIFTLEELTHNVFLDCAIQYNGSPSSSIMTGGLFNAQNVKMVGDGYGFDSPAEDNINNVINFISHGEAQEVSNAYIGFPINSIMQPMSISISMGGSAKESTLTRPKRIMFARFMFNNTIGGLINGVPITLKRFNEADIGSPPSPARGIFEISVYKAWDDFNNPTYTITHDEPFNIELLGVFYSLEV